MPLLDLFTFFFFSIDFAGKGMFLGTDGPLEDYELSK
jgi:hypothetical protein